MRNFDEDKRICDAATGSTWTQYTDDGTPQKVVYEYDRLTEQTCDIIAQCQYDNDAEFIAEAREGWPAALAEITELKAENETLREDFDAVNDALDDAIERSLKRKIALEQIKNASMPDTDELIRYIRRIAREALGNG